MTGNLHLLIFCQLITHIKDLKAGDVQDPDEVLSGLLGVQLLVDAGDHPQKHLLVDGLGQSAHRIRHLEERSPAQPSKLKHEADDVFKVKSGWRMAIS